MQGDRHLRFHGCAERQLCHTYGDARRDTGIVAEHRRELVRAAVEHARQLDKSRRDVDHPEHLEDLCYLIERAGLCASVESMCSACAPAGDRRERCRRRAGWATVARLPAPARRAR
jgi:hypothetical protein